MDEMQELLEDMDALKNVLASRATGGHADGSRYMNLRSKLIRNPLTKKRLPSFVRTCSNLDEFWSFIREISPTYAGRRDYLAEQFSPLRDFLESSANSPCDETNSALLARVDIPHVAEAWQKAIDRRSYDPEGAITMARTLLETVCKHILDDNEVEHDKDDLPKIYKKTADALNLSPSQHSEQIFKQILGGCHSVVEGLGTLRNRHSDAHGQNSKGVKPLARHAQLAVNLAGAMATFLLETAEARTPPNP